MLTSKINIDMLIAFRMSKFFIYYGVLLAVNKKIIKLQFCILYFFTFNFYKKNVTMI